MNGRLFETFARTIDSFPPKAVLKAVVRQRYMLEQDLASGRTQPSLDTHSILSFCQFLERAVRGQLVLPQSMVMDHWTFYVKTVARLVAAEELPVSVKEQIEAAFHNVFCCLMA